MILILISEFMQDEIYLEEEKKYYGDFEKVIFYSVQGHKYSNKRMHIGSNMICGDQNISYNGLLHRFWCLLTGLISYPCIKELIEMIVKKKLSKDSFKSLMLFIAKSKLLQESIIHSLKKLNIEKNKKIVFYSYRFGVGAAAAIKIKKTYKNSKAVARCHGQDLFEFRNSSAYLPFRDFLYTKIDEIYCISEDGKKYISDMYNEYISKTFVFRLGTQGKSINNNLSNENIIIVSCSRIVPIKRLDLIARSLCQIKNFKVKWIHYGDGDEAYKNNIYEVMKCASQNISFELKGFVDNNELLQIYTDKCFSFFINVSESEGLPVSIMEAASAGIPIVATDVGGTKEAVIDGYNGYLIDKNFTDLELVNIIVKIKNMKRNLYKQMCFNSRKIWEDRFSCNINYTNFVKHLRSIF